MAVAIRMKRLGRKHRPFYRIEAIEKQNARKGRSLEILGTYDPFVNNDADRVKLKIDRVQHWLDQGARPSETVTSFLRKAEVKWAPKKSRRAEQRAKRKADKK